MHGHSRAEAGQRGLVVFAVDELGCGFAVELCRRAGPGAAVWAFSWASEGWSQLLAGEWRAPRWSGEGRAFPTGLDAAVREAFRVDREAISDQSVKRIDLAFLNPPEAEAVELLGSHDGALVKRLRKRFRRIDRVFVTACRGFETFGASGVQGVLSPLPWQAAAVSGAIDFVVLQDEVNLEDRWVGESVEARELLAQALLQLTLGPAALALFARLQQERERLGTGGAYLGVGCGEWALSPDGSVTAVADLVCEQMAELVVEATQPPKPDAEVPEDGWLDEAELTELPVLDGEAARLREADERSRSTLRELFLHRQKPWVLTKLVEQRLAGLCVIEAKAKLWLMRFMERFAAWYSHWKIGAKDEAPTPITDKVLDLNKVAIFVTVCLVFLGCVATVRWTEEKFLGGVGVVVFFVIGVILGVRGFHRKEIRLIPPPTPENLLPHLRRRRARLWVVQQLIDRHQRLCGTVEKQVAVLKQLASVEARTAPEAFPLTREVCGRLMLQFGLDPSGCLLRFWDEEPRAWEALTEGEEEELLDCLRSFAQIYSQPVAGLGWPELLAVLGEENPIELTAWKQGVSRVRQTSIPWLPVVGQSLWGLVVLPHDLPEELAESLAGHLGVPTLRHEGLAGKVLAVQVSQGYEGVGKAKERVNH